jgi:hypothetical protein
MVRKATVLLCLIALGAFAVGCGSSGSSSNSTSTPSTPASTSGGGSGGGTATPNASDPAVQAAVKSCKQAIDSNPAVKSDIKPDLEKICDKAANGDIKSAQEATKEVCLKIVESSVPSGAAQDQAKSACNAATPNG